MHVSTFLLLIASLVNMVNVRSRSFKGYYQYIMFGGSVHGILILQYSSFCAYIDS